MRIALITSSFPYPSGEQFIETEIEFWSNAEFDEVYLLPNSSSGPARAVPKNLLVDTTLSRKPGKARFALRALLSKVLYREIALLYDHKKISLATFFSAWKSTASYLRAKSLLDNWLKDNGPIDLIYTYWNSVHSYAACTAKAAGLAGRVISRAHRFDLYEEQRPGGYMPLKRQFVSGLDQLFVLSHEAKSYTRCTYGVDASRISVSPLGVFIPNVLCEASPSKEFKIISVSFCVPVKRVDKIIESVARFARLNPNLNIKWCHVGGGPLKDHMIELAREKFGYVKNVQFSFLGQLCNKDVRAIYSEQEVDVFVNASESEGVPVSIIEAMSSGVPVIAPDVGGISELVDNDCGVLVSSTPSVDELCEAYSQLVMAAKTDTYRLGAREKVSVLHDATKNYPSFIDSLHMFASMRLMDD